MFQRLKDVSQSVLAACIGLMVVAGALWWAHKQIVTKAEHRLVQRADSVAAVDKAKLAELQAEQHRLQLAYDSVSFNLQPRIDSIIKYVPKWRDSIVYVHTSDTTPPEPVDIPRLCLSVARDCATLKSINDSLRSKDSSSTIAKDSIDRARNLRDIRFRDSVVAVSKSGVSKRTVTLLAIVHFVTGYGLGRLDR